MSKSYSKIRHILESNLILEKRRMILKENVTGKKEPKKYSETGEQLALRLCNTAAVYGRKPIVSGNRLIFKVDAFRSATIEFGDTENGVSSSGFINLSIPEEDMGTKNPDGTYSNFNMAHWSKFMGEPSLEKIGGTNVYIFHKMYPSTSDLIRTILGVTPDQGYEGFNTGKECGTKCIPWGPKLPSPVCPEETTTAKPA